jgi:Uma2 family endonuclease
MATKTLLTAEQFARLPGRDLLHGRLVVRIATLLSTYVRSRDCGECFAGAGFRLDNDPTVVFAPDVCYVRKERLPELEERPEYPAASPDLVIRLVSDHDGAEALVHEVGRYFDGGARGVWQIYPRDRVALEQNESDSGRIVRSGGELTHPELLPGFKLPLKEIFA